MLQKEFSSSGGDKETLFFSTYAVIILPTDFASVCRHSQANDEILNETSIPLQPSAILCIFAIE